MSVRNSPKIQKLVVNAIRKLQDVQGSTPREISNYISQEYDVPSSKIQRQVSLALARAVSYGILQRSKGGYYVCNRDTLGCQPQMEEGQLMESCAPRGRGRMKRARSRKSSRRKRASGCGRRGKLRAAARRSRKRSRRARGKSGGGRCGPSGGGKRSRRRRHGGRRSRGKKSSRRGRRRRSGRGGKKCVTGDGDDGGAGSADEINDVFGGRGSRRPRSHSAARKRSCSGSSLSGSFEDERLDEKLPDVQPNNGSESLLD